MAGSVTVIDKGWNNIKRRARMLDGRGVKVGLLADGPRSSDGVPVAEYAYYNEFGTEHIPARPFMRRTADTNERQTAAKAKDVAGDVIFGGAPARRAVGTLGAWFKERIQETIDRSPSWAKPNAPATIAAKGHAHPLVDTGLMRNSIDYEVE